MCMLPYFLGYFLHRHIICFGKQIWKSILHFSPHFIYVLPHPSEKKRLKKKLYKVWIVWATYNFLQWDACPLCNNSTNNIVHVQSKSLILAGTFWSHCGHYFSPSNSLLALINNWDIQLRWHGVIVWRTC